MNERLDHLVELLASSPTDRSLDHLEAQVTRGIAGRRAHARTAGALAPVRVASIGLALAMGVTVGGVTAASSSARPHPVGALSMTTALAPSTLLEGR
jgi:hypothetical protein